MYAQIPQTCQWKEQLLTKKKCFVTWHFIFNEKKSDPVSISDKEDEKPRNTHHQKRSTAVKVV